MANPDETVNVFPLFIFLQADETHGLTLTAGASLHLHLPRGRTLNDQSVWEGDLAGSVGSRRQPIHKTSNRTRDIFRIRFMLNMGRKMARRSSRNG